MLNLNMKNNMKKSEINKMILTMYDVLAKQEMLLARNLETSKLMRNVTLLGWVYAWEVGS